MTTRYCVEYTIEKEDTSGWKNLDGALAICKISDYELYDTENEAQKRVASLLIRDDVVKLSLTKKIILKG